MRFLFLLFILLSETFYLNAQSEEHKECFLISQYLFCPETKSIEEISLTDYKTHRLNYDYDSTTLYIFGNKFFINYPTVLDFLKDNSGAKIRTIDLEKLHVYSIQNNNFGYNRDIMLAYDDTDYYSITGHPGKETGRLSKLDSGIFPDNYERENPFIIRDKDNNKRYIVICNRTVIDLAEMPDSLPVDTCTFRYIVNEINSNFTAFYADKNGLYVFSSSKNYNIGKVADCEGKEIIPVVTPTHIIYGDKIFSRSFFSKGDKNRTEIAINLDVANFKVYNDITRRQSGTTILSDGKTAYVFSDDGGRHLSVNVDSAFSGIGQLLSKGDILFYKDEKRPRNLYLAYNTDKEGIEHMTLLKVNDEYKTIAGLDNTYRTTQGGEVYVYNTEKEQHEPLDCNSYRYVGNGFFVYQNTLYHSIYKIQDKLKDIDASKVHQFTDNNIKTKFVTDGKALIYGTDYIYQKHTGFQFMKPKLIEGTIHVYKDIDMESTKAISSSLLMDNNNLYYAHPYGLEIIPIKELGLPIKIIPVKE